MVYFKFFTDHLKKIKETPSWSIILIRLGLKNRKPALNLVLSEKYFLEHFEFVEESDFVKILIFSSVFYS